MEKNQQNLEHRNLNKQTAEHGEEQINRGR